MFKYLQVSLIVLFTIILFSGCGAGQLEVKKMNKLSSHTVEYNFPKIDPISGEKVILNIKGTS